jgi:AcrR family transcriptional regulator
VTRLAARRRAHSDAILASAVAAFGRHGYHGTSMREIADAVQRSKGSLYYYFDHKADILCAAHERALRRMEAALDKIEAAPMTAAAQLRLLMQEHVRAMVDGFHGTALALELDALRPADRRRIVARRDRYEAGLRRILERGIAAGEFRPVDPRLAGFALLGAINWIARWYRPDGPVDAEAIGRAYAALFVDGLRSEPIPQAPRKRGAR